MTKTVSKTKELLFKIALLPLFSGLIFFICVESAAQVKIAMVINDNNNLVAENTNKLNSDKTVSAVKNENPTAEETELVVDYLYDLKGAKINETELQNLLVKLGNYAVGTYKSPEGIDKRDEIVCVRFFLKKDGSIDDVKSFDNRGTEPETKLITILKSSPKSIFENKSDKADWDKILIQMNFKPKNIEEIMAKQNGVTGKVAIGFPTLN